MKVKETGKVKENKKSKLPPEVLEFFRKEGARGGAIGGKRSLETMTAADRKKRSEKAAAASARVRRLKAKRQAGGD